MTFQPLKELVISWANERNIIDGSSPPYQLLKLLSEYGELADAVVKNDINEIKDAIGDCAVIAIILAEQEGFELRRLNYDKMKRSAVKMTLFAVEDLGRYAYELNRPNSHIDRSVYLTTFLEALDDTAYEYDLTLEQCLKHAYDQIKDRRGLLIDNVYIKEKDLPLKLQNLDAQIAGLMDTESSEATALRHQAMLIQEALVKWGKNE